MQGRLNSIILGNVHRRHMHCASTAARHPADPEDLAGMLLVTEEWDWPSAITKQRMSERTIPSDSTG